MTREEAIKLLVNATYSDEWQGNEDLTTAHNMAIEALKQEQEPKISLDTYKQVTKERDIAIEQLHELGYEFGEKIEPTTKNDLGVDYISRVKVIDYLCKHCPDDGECFEDCDDIKHLRKMPSITPQEPFINKPCISTGVCEHDKQEVLDKIRAETEELKNKIRKEHNYGADAVYGSHVIHGINAVLEIFDNYTTESEGKE